MLQPGTKAPVVILRKGTKMNFTIELGTQEKASPEKQIPKPTLEIAGMAVQDVNSDIADQLGYQGQQGVIIVAISPESVAELSGFEAGMLIQQVNQQPVQNIKQMESMINAVASKNSILFLVNNQGAYRYLVLTAPQL
jgi:serine protease Do